MNAAFLKRPLARFALAWLFWTVIGLSFASQFYISSSKAGVSITWRQAVVWSLGDWYVFAFLSFPAVWLARRFPLEAGHWEGRGAIHLAAGCLFSFCYMILRAMVGEWQSQAAGESVTFGRAFELLMVKTWHFNLLIYWVIVAVSHAFDYYRKFQERELRNSALEKDLVQARLQALQMQLNPHFLFNTLHAISALMHKDVDAADRMIARLSSLLRYALESTDEQEVPLHQELDFLKRYTEIEQTRFGARLKFLWQVPPETMEAHVPNLILQPIVENAIRHGIEPHARPGEIRISARREESQLFLEVADNGGGVSEAPSEGVGLSNTRARLKHLYGPQHQFEFARATEGGLLVRLIIPFHTTKRTSKAA